MSLVQPPENSHPRRGVFVTATDTGVGKTWVGTRLTAALLATGIPVLPRKPVESACASDEAGQLIPADALALWEAAGCRGSLEEVCAWRLVPVASPERAAQMSGIDLTIAKLAEACLRGSGRDDFLLVEGAGGFYSPLARDGLNADLAERLALPVLLVAPDRLGTLSPILLAIEAMQHRGLTIAGVMLNALPDMSHPDLDNAGDLRRWTGGQVPVYTDIVPLAQALAGPERSPH